MSTVRLAGSPPMISVLLPVYNAEPYLHQAVDSLLAQTFANFELLALDDGSTDASLSILRQYEATDRRMRVISRENRGYVVALNELIAASRGQYLARMDADDICLRDRFEKQLAFFNSQPGYVLVGGMVEQVNAAGQSIGVMRSPCSHDEIDLAHLKGSTSICHPTAMYRRAAVEVTGYYDKAFMPAEDLDLWLRLGEIGKVANLSDVVLQYRLHGNSVSETNRELAQDAMRRACEGAWQRRGIKGRFELVEHWRPGRDKDSRHKFALQYGWIAWNSGNRETWWAYALEAMRLRPFAISTWRLLVFGFLKKPHNPAER